MKTLVALLAVCGSFGLCLGKGALRGMFPETYPPMRRNGVDPGEPLFLSPYIEKGQVDEARKASIVGPIKGVDQVSFSGFITVNKTTNSNMFFWFFPAQAGMDDAPIVLWLQGGPGGSSLFGLFVENGPYLINKDNEFVKRDITWNSQYSMLYIDNPVGTGFSFTDKDEGFSTNEEEVAQNLYSFMIQFYQVFHMVQKNPFYITGESYAGKYIPALGYKIHTMNQSPFSKFKINLVGLAIGDGLCDPETMMGQYADFMFQIGMLDEMQRDFFQSYAEKAVQYIKNKQFKQAFDVFDMLILRGNGSYFWNATHQEDAYNYLRTKIFDLLLNGDLYPYKPYFYNVTKTENYYNYLLTEAPEDFNYYGNVLADPAIRKAIHVGNLTYNSGEAVERHIINDIMDTVKPWVGPLMDNYRVMMYTGQLDIIVAIPLTEAFLQTVEWSGADAYKKAPRSVWKVKETDKEVAGYVRQVGDSFYQVIVRGGGHILPYDQPSRSFDMITRFIEKRGFSNS